MFPLYTVAKGFLEEHDERVNDSMPDDELEIPYENFIYIGDSDTDVPCMRVVTSKGGYSIGVYNPETDKRARVYKLFEDGRLNFFAPADYSTAGDLFETVKEILECISTKENLKAKKRELKALSTPYKLYKDVEKILGNKAGGKRIPKREQELLASLKDQVEGNTD